MDVHDNVHCWCLLCSVAKWLYRKWGRSVSTFEYPGGMPWPCCVGLVENGQRAPSEYKGALQDCQVFTFGCLIRLHQVDIKPPITFWISLLSFTNISLICFQIVVSGEVCSHYDKVYVLTLSATNHAFLSRIALTSRNETAWNVSESEQSSKVF